MLLLLRVNRTLMTQMNLINLINLMSSEYILIQSGLSGQIRKIRVPFSFIVASP